MSDNILKRIGKASILGALLITCAMPPYASYAAPAAAGQEDKDDNDSDSGAAVAPVAGDQKPVPAADAKDAKKAGKPAVSFGDYLAGRFAEQQGDTGHGIDFLRESLKKDPDNKDMQKSLYRMQVLSGKIDEAMQLAHQLEGTKVVDDGSEFTPEMLLAIEQAKQGHFDRADTYLSSIPKTGFNSLLVPLMHAWVKLGMNDLKAAVDVRNMSTEGHVVLPHVYLNAGLINDLAGFDKEAQKQYESAVKDPNIEPFRAVEALASFYGRKDMQDKRAQLVDTYLSAHGDSYLADELLKDGKSAPLVSDATQGLAEVFYTEATIFHGIRTPTDEIATLHLALYLRPDFPEAQFLLASAYELAQDYSSAITTYKSIDSKSPYFARGRIRSVYDEMALGHKDTALSELDTISHEKPQDIEALLAKGDILRIENRLKDAVSTYDEALARVKTPEKRHWIIYYSRGACYQLENQWSKAEDDMKKALALSPSEPEVLNYLGYSWLSMRQNIVEAKKMVQEAYDARPEDAHIIDSMGYALYVTGDFTGAEEYFGQALERTPNDPTVNDHLGDTYWQLGRKTEARYQWERALADSPDADTEKGLHKKLKEGLAMEHPVQSSAVDKKDDKQLPADE